MTSHSNPFWGVTPGEPPFISSPNHLVPDLTEQHYGFDSDSNGEQVPFPLLLAVGGLVLLLIATVAISTFLV